MSAFVVSKSHIDVLVAAGLARVCGSSLSWWHGGQRRELKHDNANEIGAMLWGENVCSVAHRYSPAGREELYGERFESAAGVGLPGTYVSESPAPGVAEIELPEWAEPYVYATPRRPRPPVEILKALDCFEYQSCEHDEWQGSEAFAFCDALRRRTIMRLPGYEQAPSGA